MPMNDLDRVCAVLTSMFQRIKKSKDEGQAFLVGLTPDDKFEVTTVVIMAIQGATNRHQMGFLVKALREQDQEKQYKAVGMALDVAIADSAGHKTDALYVCLEDREGNAEDVVFPYKKKLLGGFKLGAPQSKTAEPRVFGPKGDELIALVNDRTKSIYPSEG
ncbi:MAG: hypothetical protein NVS9B14_18360 [Candidatus Acidiferrum sp.]